MVDVAKISLPNAVYDDLVSVQRELAAMAHKPISLSMAVYLLTEVYRAHLRDPCARDALHQRLAGSDIMSPEEFEKACEEKPPRPRRQQAKKEE